MDINAKTKGLGLIGHPVSHSFSPAIHNAISDSLNMNYVYTAHDVLPENVETALKGLSAIGFEGVNVTVPHKKAVMPFLDEIAEAAMLIGAVNTIRIDKSRLIGYNTDCYGFEKMLEDEQVTLENKHVVLMGTGGASRAVAAACLMNNCSTLTVCSRTAEKSYEFLKSFEDYQSSLTVWKAISYEDLSNKEMTSKVDIAVNCTPLGMHPNEGITPVDPEVFSKECVLVDLIYNPEYTEFLLLGKQRGMKVVNGLGMLIHQALEAYRIWTGNTETAEFVKKALKQQGII